MKFERRCWARLLDDDANPPPQNSSSSEVSSLYDNFEYTRAPGTTLAFLKVAPLRRCRSSKPIVTATGPTFTSHSVDRFDIIRIDRN